MTKNLPHTLPCYTHSKQKENHLLRSAHTHWLWGETLSSIDIMRMRARQNYSTRTHGSLADLELAWLSEMDSKYQCSICLDVLRDPHLTECCGQHYCSACLIQWERNNKQLRGKTCPQCRTQNFRHIKNQSLMREINSREAFPDHINSTTLPATATAYNIHQKYCCVQCKVEPLIQPCLTECCGQHFCESCLTNSLQAQQQKKFCPHCRQENFVYILNKSLRREIEESYIRCIHFKDGCLWRGHREFLQEHLTTSSPDSCEYVERTCPFKFCRKTIKHTDFDRHLKLCKYRREKCAYCGLDVSHSAVNLHHDECPEILIQCPHHCDQHQMKRKDLKEHLKICPLEVIECQYKDAGCVERVARKDMDLHILTNMEKHMVLLQEQNRKLQDIVRKVNKRNKDLQKWNRELTIKLLGMQ